MEQEATKNATLTKLLGWEDNPVRVFILSHGVGVNYWGYLDYGSETSNLYSDTSTEPLLITLCRTPKKEGGSRTDVPVLFINLDDFTSFQIVEFDSRQLVLLKNQETRTQVVIERG